MSLKKLFDGRGNIPEEFQEIIAEFEKVCLDMIPLLNHRDADVTSSSLLYPNFFKFRDKMRIGRDTIDIPFTLEELYGFCNRRLFGRRKSSQEEVERVRTTWPQLSDELSSATFQIPKPVSQDRQKLASVLLLRGYTRATQNFYNRSDMADIHMLSFGEILTLHNRDTQLYKNLREFFLSRQEELPAGVVSILQQE